VQTTGDESAARALDAFLKTSRRRGVLYALGGSNLSSSERTRVVPGEALRFLWNFRSAVDVLDLGHQRAPHKLQHFAAALGAGIVKPGHTLVVAGVRTHSLSEEEEDPLAAFLRGVACSVVTPPSSARRGCWVC